jgi:hypothetical protein
VAHQFCRDAAINAGEPLAGTGAIYQRLLLLAWPRRHWRMPRGTSVGMDAELGAAVSHAVAKGVHLILCDRPGDGAAIARLQAPNEAIAADFADTAGLARAITAYADGGALAGRSEARTTILCCTDSRRDACCARHGQATLTALLERADAQRYQVLQASHLGGCRFAASLMVLPRREHYGRLEPAQVDDFLLALDAGEPFLSAFRGRADLPPSAQVAEIAARQWAAERGLPAIGLSLEALRLDDEQADYAAHLGSAQLTIALCAQEARIFGTCAALAAGNDQPMARWRVRSIAAA